MDSSLKEISKKELDYLNVINSFAQGLMSAGSVHEIVWSITDNAISKMGYHDCVVYLLDKASGNLVQISAYGPKKTKSRKVKDPIVIKPDEGVVGSVFTTGVGEIINDTSLDSRYITDDAVRYSEITVPIILNGEIIGIIDSEHPERYFFTNEDFEILSTISNLTSIKLERVKEIIDSKNQLETAVHNKTRELRAVNKELVRQNLEKEVLMKEIHHRVKNNMQIIISLLNMQINESKSENERLVFKECANRMHAIADIHGKLYFEKNVLKIPVEEFFYELGSSLIMSFFATQEIDFKLNISVQDVSLNTGIPLGLTINELINHSLKLGFASVKKGIIKIEMVEDHNNYTLVYKDNGIGFDPQKFHESIFGFELMEILVEQLDGELKSTPSKGTHLTLVIPKPI